MTLNLYSNLPYANDVKEFTMLNQNLSAKLKNHRKSVWMTQKQLSDKSGVSLTEIRNIERQRTNASLDTVDLLADALEISPIELLK